MFYLTLRFAFIAVLFQAPCTVVAQDANSVVKNMLGMREKQNSCITKHINSLPKTAILVTIETISKAKGGSQKDTALKLCNRQSEGGFLVNMRNNGSVDVYLCNENYNAMLTKDLKSALFAKGSSKVDITKLKDSSMSMNSFSKAAPSWMDQTFPNSMTQLYFAYGGIPLDKQHSQWLESGGSVSLSNSKIPNCVDLVFEGWPNTTGPAVYAVDAVGVIHEMRRNFKKGNAVYRVEEFLEFDGVKIPKKVVSQHTNIESKFEVESRSSWEEVALADVGYDPKQLYATYYGLPEPDLQVLPKTPWRVPRLLLLGSALIVGFLIYYALRIQKKNA